MCTVAAPSLELISRIWTCDLSAVTGTLLLPELQTCHGSQHQHGCFPRAGARWKWFVGSWAKQLGKIRGQYISCLMSLWWHSCPAPHYPVLSKTWCHGPGLHTPDSTFFFHVKDLVEIRLPSDCFNDRLKTGGTACIQRVTGQGRASFLPQELLWHIPMPCVLLPSCQSPSFSECGCGGNAPLTLCVSGHKIPFCRLLTTQRSATNKGGLRISHSRGCKLSV